MHFHIITLFPDVCRAYTGVSILGRAQKTNKGKGAKVRGKKIEVSYYNPRDFSQSKHYKVDDKPYGGGPGMVMQVEPVVKAWDKAVGRKRDQKKVKTLIMSPRGKKFTQDLAKEYAKKYDHLVLISGRYEGIDDRVRQITNAEEVSVGDYILTGGELPALTIIDATARQIPGVLGDFESLEDERLTNGKVYTRPEVFKYKKQEYKVPEVLLSGNPALVEKWQRES
ncbi:MAG: tRNA (guanosine(37)-N1)-methyltransferase TrmD [Candidatus Nomurabacteria bacterium]|nr:MAG: tRNA (guanosine(37)-N1)-methyltransferase TrmD [Candidatus Nomurabacteria bacterium]